MSLDLTIDKGNVVAKFDGQVISTSSSITDILLFEILQKLREVNGNVIDVETAVDKIYMDN